VETRKRLRDIQVKANANNVRRYLLGYIYSPSTSRSLLNSVTEYGSDFATALPPLVFTYQTKPFEFEAQTSWLGVSGQGRTNASWNGIRASDASSESYVDLIDVDRDGLPDRVMRKYGAPYDSYVMQRNTGNSFAAENSWTTLSSQGDPSTSWNSISGSQSHQVPSWSGGRQTTHMQVLDLNSDGLPDRVMRDANTHSNPWRVQFATGLTGAGAFNGESSWSSILSESNAFQWYSIHSEYVYGDPAAEGQPPYYSYLETIVDLADMNGDGLSDRVLRKLDGTWDRYKVQLNTRSGFGPLLDWAGIQGNGALRWSTYPWDPYENTMGTGGNIKVLLQDINGDGLPDRVTTNSVAGFTVQFNNGSGFEAPENWGPLDSSFTICPMATDMFSETFCLLSDINGDGLPDRVMGLTNSANTNFVVQFNNGHGFNSAVPWGPLEYRDELVKAGVYVYPINPPFQYEHHSVTYVDFMDINGDGLPDRVMQPSTAPLNSFVVQLNKGPFPDLLSTISNSIGGSIQVSYKPSTQYDNRDRTWTGDPWTANAVGLLPFPVYTVSAVVVQDGLSDPSTNTYTYSGGMQDFNRREFRGFNCVEATDPLGMKTRTYFHQSGGRDGSTNGEYQDQSSKAKKGMPYRVEVIGSDGLLYNLTLNKVEEIQLHANGRYFPYVSQTIQLDYEGLSNPRATATQFIYDTSTGNLTNTTSLGEVTNVVFSTHALTDIGSDSVYTHTTFSVLSNPDIKDKPATTKITSDPAGNTKLRETRFFYEGTRGNLTTNQAWLGGSSYLNTSIITYDQYGNPKTIKDPANIVTTNFYDATYQTFVLTNVTATFTNQVSVDVRSGAVITATDAKGLVSSNSYDVFYRPKESWISTTPYGPPSLWVKKIDYTLSGVASGVSYNFVWTRVNDAVDTVNGHESFTYTDGLGRVVQTRVEAETGQYRATDTLYDDRGNPNYQTLPYFSSGFSFAILTGFHVGALTEFDAIGRTVRTTPGYQITFDGNGQILSQGATGGDSGSPLASSQVAFVDGSDPWATVTTDSEGKIKKSYYDAYRRVKRIVEVNGSTNYNTYFGYNLVGDLTKVTNHTGKVTTMTYDNLGRKTYMTDPDMGAWSYTFDNASRLIEQLDPTSNWIRFYYNDPLGRIKTKEIYDPTGYWEYYGGGTPSPVATVTYTYDSAGSDPDHTVFKGQLYKIIDREGTQRFSYDVRGRVLKSTRYLTKNLQTYTTETTYDDADRPVDITYPGAVAKIKYTYDTGGNLSQVRSLSGTVTQEVFYSTPVFSALGQLTSVKYGNTGANQRTITNLYHANSKRLQRMWTTNPAGGYHQDLAYTYDRVSNVKSITDSVTPSGMGSGSITNVFYDDLHRLTQMTSTALGSHTYAYDAIGNILTNSDLGTGTGQYTYHATKIHAVTGANGRTYSYDNAGNMTSRGTGSGNQSLTYNEENRLISVYKSGSPYVTFGYADDGTRLWRDSTGTGGTGLSVWIGSLYEVRGGKTLCHVFAEGKRVATFEPQGGGPWAKVIGEERWHVWSRAAEAAFLWPFQYGRTPTTVLILTLTGILLASVMSRCRWRWGAHAARVPLSAARRQHVPKGWKWLGGLSWLRTLLPFLTDKVGVRAVNNDQSAILNSQFSMARLRPAPIWQQLISVSVIAALVLATTNTNVHAQQYDPVFYYYHTDHLGSSSIITDRNGTLVKHYEYCAFGKERYASANPAFAMSHRFTGQILDDETGLYFYESRYYDPELGRFTQPDTIVPDPDDPQTLNRYTYTLNNPLKYVDPTGHAVNAATGRIMKLAQLRENNVYTGSHIPGNVSPFLYIGGLPGEVYAQRMAEAKQQAVMNAIVQSIQSQMNRVHTAKSSSPVVQPGPKSGSTPDPGSPGNTSNPANSSASSELLKGVTDLAGKLSMLPGPVGSIAGAVEFAGNLAQGHWKEAAWAAAGAAAAFFGGAAVVKLLKTWRSSSKTTVTVTRWGREGLQPGDWVMTGAKTRSNYWKSGKWQPEWMPGRNKPASFPSGQSFEVPASSLRLPRMGDVGTEFDNAVTLRIKGWLGQRIYDPTK